jgi:hypothetical protein
MVSVERHVFEVEKLAKAFNSERHSVGEGLFQAAKRAHATLVGGHRQLLVVEGVAAGWDDLELGVLSEKLASHHIFRSCRNGKCEESPTFRHGF